MTFPRRNVSIIKRQLLRSLSSTRPAANVPIAAACHNAAAIAACKATKGGFLVERQARSGRGHVILELLCYRRARASGNCGTEGCWRGAYNKDLGVDGVMRERSSRSRCAVAARSPAGN